MKGENERLLYEILFDSRALWEHEKMLKAMLPKNNRN